MAISSKAGCDPAATAPVNINLILKTNATLQKLVDSNRHIESCNPLINTCNSLAIARFMVHSRVHNRRSLHITVAPLIPTKPCIV